MPHINRIRVNNVKYNFGTQFYDDFLMRFSCKNTIYDLANGGGKSVLMLLLLQNLIPNCTLDDKQPIEKLFRTGSGSNTIHSLIEWKLSEPYVKNNFKYMLTGFCARKSRQEEDEVSENAAIDYFNYCIFYREFNENDIKNLPLSSGKERITYNGLKSYLRELEKKDYSLEIKIFDRKGDYQRFIANYGLFESEWEIIRGINKTEGHVRTYFENNYKTARKVVEDLLIEEIIEKSFKNRVAVEGNEDIMAQTLLDIKDKLLELSGRKEDISSYDRQIESLESFANRVKGIKQLYFGKESIEEQIIKSYHSLKSVIMDKEAIIDNCMQEEEKLLLQQKGFEKSIDTVKIQKLSTEIESIDNELKGQEEKALTMQNQLKENKDKILLAESQNDYLDYIYYKKERDTIKELIMALSSDKSGITSDLSKLASEKFKRDSKKREHFLSEIEKEEKIVQMGEEIAKGLSEKEEDFLKELSVFEYLIKDSQEKLEVVNEVLSKEKGKLGRLILVDIKKEKEEILGKIYEVESKLKAGLDDKSQLTLTMKDLDYEKQAIEKGIKELDVKLDNLIDERREFAEKTQKAEKIMQLYNEKNIDKLVEQINNNYKEAIGEIKDKKEELSLKKDYLKQLEKGCPVGNSKETKLVLEYIEKYHGGCAVSGSDFIANLDDEQRRQVIEKNPLVPYSIIIMSGYNRIASDTGLRSLLCGNYAVSLLRVEVINEGEYIFNPSDVMFITRDEGLFIDSQMLQAEQKKVEIDIEKIEARLLQLEEASDIFRDDYSFLEEYQDIYIEKITLNQNLYEESKLLVKKAELDAESCKENIRQTLISIEQLEGSKGRLDETYKELLEEQRVINVIDEHLSKSRELEDTIRECTSKQERYTKESKEIKARLDAQVSSDNARKEQISLMKAELSALEDKWEKIYKTYYDEGVSVGIEYVNLTDDEIETRFNGLYKALSSEKSDLEDKQKLINNYDIAMEKSLQAIDYKGIFVQDIGKLYEEGKIKNTTKEELMANKKSLDVLDAETRKLLLQISSERSKRDKLEGAMNHGKSLVEEKYGEFVEIEISAYSYDTFISEKEAVLVDISNRLEEIKLNIKSVESMLKEYALYERDLDKIIQESNVDVSGKKLTWDANTQIEEKIKEVSSKHDKFKREVYERKEEFSRERSQLVETLKFLKSNELAKEISDSVIMPSDANETDELIKGLEEIIECIRLEKSQVESGIADMNIIKENFENQCIQSCINIKSELERLPSMSKIVMDNETIPIIGLSIPYVKEEFFKEKMSEYIDTIVKTSDTIKSETERIKYIKNQLAWKKLFSVLVTDMNRIKLTLYKRERIKEQSKYLPYEEAVGSTGQSQGIYIQFLIAVINYIASINSNTTQSKELGKVIFIDNPFGAAKDIYIWEPIFKMLKTNNVQLIVPCRGATPAITGRFDVNYVLGQKMIDSKQQTVVVDYYSNVQNDNMEYEKLTFEQSSFSF